MIKSGNHFEGKAPRAVSAVRNVQSLWLANAYRTERPLAVVGKFITGRAYKVDNISKASGRNVQKRLLTDKQQFQLSCGPLFASRKTQLI